MTDYATWQQLRDHLGLAGTSEQPHLENLLAAAHETVHDYCGWRFDQTAGVYLYEVRHPYLLELGDLPLASSTGVAIEVDENDAGTFTALNASTYQLRPVNGRQDGMAWPYTHVRRLDGSWPSSSVGRYTVRITGTFGWPSVPAKAAEAVLQVGAWLYQSKASPSGQVVTDFGPVANRIPAPVQLMLHRYRRAELVAAIGVGRAL